MSSKLSKVFHNFHCMNFYSYIGIRHSLPVCCLSNQLHLLHTLSADNLKESATFTQTTSNDPIKRHDLTEGPGLSHFLANVPPDIRLSKRTLEKLSHPYVAVEDVSGHGRKVYFEVHGCQMNVSDVEVTWSVLKSVGYEKTQDIKEADVILLMTCAIREGAEQKIWNKLTNFKYLKKRREESGNPIPVKIGVLGCMAERLKKEMLEKEKAIDMVMGPDSYRDLPRLLAITQTGDRAVNVLLSQEETYADIMPVSLTQNRVSAFVSIMRGCDNMCSYCIVPFTRGRERSRPIPSILEEVRTLSGQGIKEITLLGQNVNSYCDTSETAHPGISVNSNAQDASHLSEGFQTIYKPKKGGLRFATLLEHVSEIDPDMRIRFTSPHPKDFPDEVLSLIQDRHNICKQIHLPAQSGNSRVLEIMRRGYTRESYLKLVHHIRAVIPRVSFSSDFIAGFCSETEEEFQDTLSLMDTVQYNSCFIFPYSLREKTPAHRDLKDDVPKDIKLARLARMSETFRRHALARNSAQIGEKQVVLVQGRSFRSASDLAGRNDGNTKVIFPLKPLSSAAITEGSSVRREPRPGDYVEVEITGASSQVLLGTPVALTTLQGGEANVAPAPVLAG